MRGRRWHLPLILAIVVPAIVAGWTLTAVSAADQPSPSASLPGDPTKGAAVFSSQGCTSCHGANLEGGVGPKLNPITQFSGVSNPLDPNYLKTTILNGRSGDPGFSVAMPSFQNKVSDQDLNDVVSYIIFQNESGSATLSPTELARSTVFWVTIGISLFVLCTYLLSRYNMRWIARRAAARREGERPV